MAKKTKLSGDRKSLLFGDGPLDKAVLIFINPKGKETFRLPVQFNPKEYSISRSMDYKATNGNGKEAHPMQLKTGRGRLAKLKVSMAVDSASEIRDITVPRALKKFINDQELTDLCRRISMLTKYNHKTHYPDGCVFSWGNMHFQGYVTSLSIAYTMFSREGKPIRAKIDMTIEGEEREILKEIKAKPEESPDCTKYRSLNQGDELWMLAQQEYADPALWKEIASENEILNPRRLDHTRLLKIPAL